MGYCGDWDVITGQNTTWYEHVLARLESELAYVHENLEDLTPPSEAVLKEVKDFLANANALEADIPLITISNDGDVNLRWGRGYETLLVSFCFDGLDHYCHRYQAIDRNEVFEVLRDR
jgi:hypothetical protein